MEFFKAIQNPTHPEYENFQEWIGGNFDSILGLSLIVVSIARGTFVLPMPNYLRDAITLLPFYHYKEAIHWAAGLDYDKQILLHLTWLIWATVTFSAIAKLAEGIALWSYQREQAVQ